MTCLVNEGVDENEQFINGDRFFKNLEILPLKI